VPKELIISFAFLGVFLLALIWGVVDTAIVQNPIFLLLGVVAFVGQIVTAHLAFNQFNNSTEPETANQEKENEQGRDEGESDGFDD
jgi:hypothetical protein|tara:strand:+ start:1092 stop:1349 length:258 start_codon:yes stop_codon:yes gene_type:complete